MNHTENKQLISIIIPTYNVEQYIIPCLESVSKQSYKNIECIIVDDCGEDLSIKFAEQFIDCYSGPISFYILHREKNGGLSAARNSGIREAKGDYIYFLDSDDILYPNSIEILLKNIGNCDICVGSYKSFSDDKTKTLNNKKILTNIKIYGRNNVVKSYVKGMWPVMAWNKLIKTSFIKKHLLFFKEDLIHEDEMWTFEVFKYIESISLCSYTTYQYRQRPGSIMTTENPKNRMDLAKILRDIITYTYDSNDTTLNEYCQYMYKFISVSVFSNKISLNYNKAYYKIISGLSIKMTGKNFWGKMMAFAINNVSFFSFCISYIIAGLRKRDLIHLK